MYTHVSLAVQEFIRNNPSQSQPLLQAILQTPSLTGLLAPNFNPNSSPEMFVAMYEDLLPVPAHQGVDVAYSLLTKVSTCTLSFVSLSRPTYLVLVD